MKNENKKMIVEVQKDIYREIEAYCAQSDLSERDFIDKLVRYFLNENLKMLDAMRRGYMEMAGINLDICTEFDQCELEVAPLI